MLYNNTGPLDWLVNIDGKNVQKLLFILSDSIKKSQLKRARKTCQRSCDVNNIVCKFKKGQLPPSPRHEIAC